ncbi:hypothetical protein [Vibrio sp. Vb2960]|uniref:hypothetical protein n=1 Tax=Vibrio sp. Vb2960 TaxID=3074693 RepID=UPI0029653FA3|nr:hypothetical protein [Vibrio sp. Vb2960]MDW1599664.1 hypothetical protein [Vibrio sp. Vb2960]
MFNFNSNKKVASTPLSHFVKRTSSGDKKKVYRRVIVAASEAQNSTIEQAKDKSVA